MYGSASSRRQKTDWLALGSQLMTEGNFGSAAEAFTYATQTFKKNPLPLYNLALAEKCLGNYSKAAEHLTNALDLNPFMIEAARELGVIISSFPLSAKVYLNTNGLRAAINFETLNRDQIAEVAVYYLSSSHSLKVALEEGRQKGFDVAARNACLDNTADVLKSDLLGKALRDNIIRMPELEIFLAALRKVVLLEIPFERFQDKALVAFISTLARQCWLNEYVWSLSKEEEEALKNITIDRAELISGNPEQGLKLLILSLYTSCFKILGAEISTNDLKNLRPNGVRDVILEQVEEQEDLKRRISTLRQFGTINDETSLKVASQYELNPYPRWTSLGLLSTQVDWAERLKQTFGENRLQFMTSPFEILIAGCGTGLQAIAAAHLYGPNARITAIDISSASLAYAKRKAQQFKVTNVNFIQADILNLAEDPEFLSRFHIIECVGVLHHMADPLKGWRVLKTCLKSEGIMLIALYSEMARKKWTALKKDPLFPGNECSLQELRAFRENLFRRSDAELGAEFKGIRDLYVTSGFRDLILHVNEHRFTIPQVEKFLNDEKLKFKGFYQTPLFEKFKTRYPKEQWPGKLEHWAQFENENPKIFSGMYYFWCSPS